ncbi:DUF2281 domain-containing protein [Vulcanibacillus modesticaldus]|uniref:DUF2281 domain-containing protein n=1 Tax=Vulcanibacillus modesticaldus TaxID=337097 RepID=UPI000AC846CA|nr:DUF2281 domain-containing protein [Vulcanibacillus modesticaldus]
MSLEEKLLKDFQSLSDDKKREVIDFVEFLKIRNREVVNLMDDIIEENREAFEELSK